MSAKGLKTQFSYDDILHSELDSETQTITHQTGNAFGGETEGSSDCEDWSNPIGLASLPSPPTGEGDEKQAAQALKKNESDYDAILGQRDLRMNYITGNLKPGETCVYGSGEKADGQNRIMLKNKNIISLLTRKDADAPGMIISMDPATDTITLQNAAGAGITITGKKIVLTTGDAVIQLTDAIAIIAKAQALIDGSTIALGATAVPVAGGVCVGATGIASKPSSKVIAAP